MRKRRGKKEVKAGGISPFWKNAIFRGIKVAVPLGLFGAVAGSVEGRQGAILFGFLGLVVGFVVGFLMKAIDKLPPRKSTYLSKGNYIGGNRIPDIEETPGYPEDKRRDD